MKLQELYSREEDREKIKQAQDSILTVISTDEGSAVLSVAQSRVTILNDDFRERLVRGLLADEDYIDMFEKLQDPHAN